MFDDDNTPAQVPAADPELGAILREAAELDAERASAEGASVAPELAQAPAPAPADYLAESRQLVRFAAHSILPLYPSLARVYTESVQADIAGALAPILFTYDVSISAWLGRHGVWLPLVMVAVPLIAPTVQAVREDRAAAQADQAAPPPPVRAEPAAPAGMPVPVFNLDPAPSSPPPHAS